MPYICTKEREILDKELQALKLRLEMNFDQDSIEGALNYCVSNLLEVIPYASSSERHWRYKFCNRAVGVLECIKLELYRRLIGNYEDQCIKKNGDITIYQVNNERIL